MSDRTRNKHKSRKKKKNKQLSFKKNKAKRILGIEFANYCNHFKYLVVPSSVLFVFFSKNSSLSDLETKVKPCHWHACRDCQRFHSNYLKKTHSYLFMALFFIIIIRHFPSNLSPFYWNHPRLKKKIIIIILFQDFSPWAALKKETNNNNKPLRSCSKHEIVVPGKQRVRVPSRKRKALNKD